ncbi:hypothetical protein LUZ60_016151 [Juncus effusus]|nr:hypothetical protein LUZ60_016151 [Juncus effusus]
MAQVAVVSPLLRRLCSASHSSFSACSRPRRLSPPFSVIPCFSRGFSRVWGLKPAAPPADMDESDWEEAERERVRASRFEERKSKNELKREARRAVEWGMELAKLSPSQIKRAIRIASLEDDVYEAFMLLKRMAPDVREGKRRQFNYIGSLLRNAEPEIMDALIKAYKDGDTDTLNLLTSQSQTSLSTDEDENHDEKPSIQNEVDEEYVQVATRWFEGLIGKDVSITNEVYSLHNVEFDRQELRKLVKRVQTVQESKADVAIVNKETRPLMRFLRSLAKKIE